MNRGLDTTHIRIGRRDATGLQILTANSQFPELPPYTGHRPPQGCGMASRRTNAYVGVGLNERFIDDGYEDKHLHGITDAHATATVISIMGSIGVFNLPYALNAGGWLGLPLILLCGAMSLYTARLLVSCLHSGDDGKRIASYAALGEVAFGSSGRVVVLYFQYATLLGMAALTMMAAGAFLVDVFVGGPQGNGFFPQLSNLLDFGCPPPAPVPEPEPTWVDGFSCSEHRWYQLSTTLVALITLFVLVCLPTLGEARIAALLGSGAFVLSALAGIINAFLLYPLDADEAARFEMPFGNGTGPSTRLAPEGISGLALAISAISLSFGGHSALPSIEGECRVPFECH